MGLCFGKQSNSLPGAPEDAPKFVASLDFGTTFSGFAFCQWGLDSKQIEVFNDWPGTVQALAAPSIKTVTSLLYERVADRQWILREWGWMARVRHNELELRGSQSGQQWFRAERFKLNLSEDRSKWVELPPGLTVETCIKDSLRVLGNMCYDRIRASHPDTQRDQIQWCLTVPAMWSDRAKQLMKKLAIDSGLYSANSRFPVLIVLEPEAASFYSLYNVERPSSVQGNAYRSIGSGPGVVDGSFLIVDAGGGTVDLAVHRRNRQTDKVEEVTAAEGGLCGGSYVDLQFFEYLKTIPWIRALNTSRTVRDGKKQAVMTYLFQKFETLKCSYGTNSYMGAMELPNLPPEILDAYFPNCDSPELLLSSSLMRSFFDPVVDQILPLIEDRLRMARDAGLQCQRMLLVGGFSANDYLADRIRGRFAPELQGVGNIVRPEQPRAAVLKGAIMYGLHPEKFGSRVCKRTYGIRILRPWTEGTRPDLKRIYDGREFAFDMFKKYVTAGDHVPVNQTYAETFFPEQPGARNVDIEIWSTRAQIVSRTTEPGVQQEQAMVVSLGEVGKNEKRGVKVEFYFGDTAIKVVATPQTSWHEKGVAGVTVSFQLV